MNYELISIDPLTYRLAGTQAFGSPIGLKIEKEHNQRGSFSFSLASSLAEFESAITTPNGMCQVMAYIEGKPYIHGIISNYTPSDEGYITVECIEILQLLEDNIIEGNYELSNIEMEYVPPATGITDSEATEEKKVAYWDKEKGASYWYSLPTEYQLTTRKTQEGSNIVIEETTNHKGYYLNEDSKGVTSTGKGTIFNRQLNASGRTNHSLYLESNGITALLVSPICEELPTLGQGIFMDITRPGVPPEQSYTADTLNNSRLVVYGKGIDGEIIEYAPGLPLATIIPLPTFFNGDVEVSAIYAAMFGTVNVGYTLSETAEDYFLDLFIRINYNGQSKFIEFTGIHYPKSAFDTNLLTARGSLSIVAGSTLTKADIYKEDTKSLLEWMNEASELVSFVAGNESDATLQEFTKLTYSDASRLAIVNDLIELAGTISLDYVGIVNGKPTYAVYDYSTLEQAYKFVGSDDVFNIEYKKDFADVYNVLTARANYTYSNEQYNINNSMQMVIRPDVARPNRLGRLKEKVISSDSIKDIYTLTVWANYIYNEHCYPATPIDFDTYLDDFWIGAKFGQTIVMHGLEEGKGISEKLQGISIDTTTGVASVKLAKRITLQSALLESRIKAYSR